MLFWFAGLAFAGVVLVFASPAVDYRLVMVGAVIPVLEWPLGGPWLLHTLVASVAVMTAVMLVFRGRRLLQRQWLALPIGMFAHLVLDGTWAVAELFWWPLFGASFAGLEVPEATRPAVVLVVMEVIGLAVLWWLANRYRLTEPERRRSFLRSGRLDRDVVG